MGILDTLMMSVAVMKYSREEAVDYLARAISRFARKEYIMFFHNPGSAPIPGPFVKQGSFVCLTFCHCRQSLGIGGNYSKMEQSVIPGFSQDRDPQL